MTKGKKRIVTEARQETIFEYLKKVEQDVSQAPKSAAHPNGSLDIDTELRNALSEDLKQSKSEDGRALSRYEVAGRMSELVGMEITKSMLDNYTAEAHEKHRFPCQFLPAFVVATGGQRIAFECISRHAGLFALPGAEALRAEIQKYDEEERRARSEKNKRRMYLHEIERGGKP